VDAAAADVVAAALCLVQLAVRGVQVAAHENKSGHVVGNPVLNVSYPRRYLAFFYGKPTAFVHLRLQQGDAGEGICGRRGARLLLKGIDKLFGPVAVFFCRRFMSKSLDTERHGRHAVRSGEAELLTCWPLGESAASVHLASIGGRTVIEATPISSPTRPQRSSPR
jgi:hypothetical protein